MPTRDQLLEAWEHVRSTRNISEEAAKEVEKAYAAYYNLLIQFPYLERGEFHDYLKSLGKE